MKIGIVTVVDSANFGSFLQGYALKRILESWGHKTYFLSTRDKKYVKKLYYCWKPGFQSVKHPIKFLKRNLIGCKTYSKFLEDHRKINGDSEINKQELDLIILGSDEIWNVCTEVFRKLIFYGNGYHSKVAYAVSAGNAKYTDFLQFPEIIQMIQKVDDIFVRDKNTFDIVKEITSTESQLVCDPTILVGNTELSEPCEDEFLLKHEYMLVYMYPNTLPKEKVLELKKFAGERNLKLVSAGLYQEWCDYHVICRPMEFSSVVQGAEYVITATFHGSIFSILNQKQFLALEVTFKVKDLLKRIGLESHLIQKDEISRERLEIELTKNMINYLDVNHKMEQWRKYSEERLKEVVTKYANGDL